MYEKLEENGPYQQYVESGGVFDEGDYAEALQEVRDAMEITRREMPSEQGKSLEKDVPTQSKTMAEYEAAPEKNSKSQVKMMAEHAGIELDEDKAEKGAILYTRLAKLRANPQSKEEEDRFSHMSDQRLFAEALRILGDTDSLNKLIKANHKEIGTNCPICSKLVTPGEGCH